MLSTNHRQTLGKKSEHAARQFLETRGMKLITQNYRCFYGEIDLIMQDQDDIVFVEVRSRSRQDYGSALESIRPNKVKKLIKAATHFLQKQNWLYTKNSRFDVVTLDIATTEIKIDWIRNAFWPER